jgi:hypothetical protein
MLSLPPPASGKVSNAFSHWARAVPAEPIDAFAFLYLVVFKELLCHGRLTDLGRRTGRGELELELLLFVSVPSRPVTGAISAIEQPMIFAKAPAWYEQRHARFDAESAYDLRVRHLIAICECAKRVMTLGVLDAALTELERAFHGKHKDRGKDYLRYIKLKIDYRLHMDDRRNKPETAKSLMRVTIQNVALRIARRNTESIVLERVLRSKLREMRTSTRNYIKECLRDSRYVDPDEVNRNADEASAAIIEYCPLKKYCETLLTVTRNSNMPSVTSTEPFVARSILLHGNRPETSQT